MPTWLDVDCESVGLMGNTKLIQFGIDNGPVQMIPLYRGWINDVKTVRSLVDLFRIMDSPLVIFRGFNVAFDLFHLYRLRHQLHGYLPTDGGGRTIQPFGCGVLDLQVHAMLHSELAPFAFSRGRHRSVACVRRIPRVAQDFVQELVESRLRPHIPEFFRLNCSERKVPNKKDLISLAWSVEGTLSLKNLAKAWGLPTMQLAEVWPLPDKGMEKPWLPYPDPAIHDRIEVLCEDVMRVPTAPFWSYATLDILLLRYAYEKLGKPALDIHSENAHATAYTRFCGFELDCAALERSIAFYSRKVASASAELSEDVLKSSVKRLAMLRAVDPLVGSSKKSVLLALAESDRPSAPLAAKMLAFGPNRQRLLQLQKVAESLTGRAHPDLRVMGTSTLRAAGTAGLNWQGISTVELDDLPSVEIDDLGEAEDADAFDEEPEVAEEIAEGINETERFEKVGLRACIKAPCVGDWSSFEVVLASHIYPDPQMLADLQGKIDPHSMVATLFHPDVRSQGLDYPAFKALVAAKDPWATKIRKNCKAVTFGLAYWCAAPKISDCLGISLADAQTGMDNYYARYSGFARFRKTIEDATMTADTKHWSADSVGRMARVSQDVTGHQRTWFFEADVADTLWRLGHGAVCSGFSGSIIRTMEKGTQTIDQSIRSALLGSAIAIQGAVGRQRGNTPIQMSGACINKELGAVLWKKHRIPLLNIHDEWVLGRHPNFDYEAISATIDEFVRGWAARVPCLNFEYGRTEKWSDK